MVSELEQIRHMPLDMAAYIILDEARGGPEGSALPAFVPKPETTACALPEGGNPGYDAPLPANAPTFEVDGIRTEIVTSYDIGKAFYKTLMLKKFESLAALLWYGTQHPTRGGKKGMKKKKIDVEALAQQWVEVVARLAVSHTKDELDAYEAQLDEILTPILHAPVKQLREFFPRMVELLKADERVPFFVWRGFEVWQLKTVANAPDEEVVELRTALAKEIVDLLSPDVQTDITEAMVNALQWRSTSKLEEIRDAVKAGGKPRARQRVVGHESCLFLEIEGAGGEKVATVQI